MPQCIVMQPQYTNAQGLLQSLLDCPCLQEYLYCSKVNSTSCCTSCCTPMCLFQCIPLGHNAAQSLHNLQNWMDSIAISNCREDPMVLYDDGTRAHGLYHRMRQAEHTRFMALLNRLSTWMTQCRAANISCGKLMSIEPAERGALTIIHIPNVGPFVQ